MLKILLWLAVAVAIVFLGFLWFQGRASATGSAPGLSDGMLAACPDKPNCVCSENPDDTEHYIDALALPGVEGQELAVARQALLALGGQIVDETPDYLAATFTSALFRFVDDVEIRLGPVAGELQVRSASRVGYSDFGANRDRVEAVRQALAAR